MKINVEQLRTHSEIKSGQSDVSRIRPTSTVITGAAWNANSDSDQLTIFDSTYLQPLRAFHAVVNTITNVSDIITSTAM